MTIREFLAISPMDYSLGAVLAFLVVFPLLLVVAFLAMVAGEAWRVPAPGLVRDAPLAQATAVALVLSTSWPSVTVTDAAPQVGPMVGVLGPLALAVAATLIVGVVTRHWSALHCTRGRRRDTA